jgi:periplasmic protein CpxP/Spy
MKKLSLIAALAIGGLIACSTLVTAQDAPKKGKGGYSPEQQLERMTTTLSLTDEQKPKVKAVLEETSKKMKDLRSETDQTTRREKMKPIMDEQNTKLKAILTPEQFTKYQEMRPTGGKGGGKKKSQ